MDSGPEIAPGRLTSREYADNFDDIKPPLDRRRALIESSRCYFCHDAPCVEACPTGIDIPSFIRKISTDNVKGAAVDILQPNILGGACARVCPTEELCEEACVRHTQENKPVRIGALQRYATDWLLDSGQQPFERGPATGKRVAVVGGGPASLACAHRCAMLGHEVTIFEAKDKLGGLNEYGIAGYKVPHDFAQREVKFILNIGGITVQTRRSLGRDVSLSQLRQDHDAVFLGLGHTAVRALGIDDEDLSGVHAAVDYIAQLRQTKDLSTLPVGRRIVVIGGGNTAIDIAVQTKRLGAEDVTMVYRRGPGTMSATGHERELAQTNGVKIKLWAQPKRLVGANGAVRAIEFEYTQLDDIGRLMGTGDHFTLAADQVFKAIGQKFVADPLNGDARETLETAEDRIVVNDDRQTSLRDVFAGGDCIVGRDLTVQAVEDGKVAAIAIDCMLRT